MASQIAPDPLHQAVVAWLESHGLTLGATYYDFGPSFYAWRHYGNKQSLTLWVSQIAAEDYEATTIIAKLREFEPKALMEKFRHAHLHVASSESGLSAYARAAYSPTGA